MGKYSFEDWRRAEVRRAVKRADPAIRDDFIRFLEDDPRTFGSGYMKESIWKYIKRYDLTPEELNRLEDAAMKLVYRPMSHEFKHMCQTMCVIATDEFWQRVEAEKKSDNPVVKLNASCLYPYSESMEAGEKQRLAWKHNYRLRREHSQFNQRWNVGYSVDDLGLNCK